MKIKLLLLAIILGLNFVSANPPAKKRILVYTKNGKGYVHKNIAASVEALKKIGEVNNLIVDVSDDPSVMTIENLAKYSCLVFSNTCNVMISLIQKNKSRHLQRICSGEDLL